MELLNNIKLLAGINDDNQNDLISLLIFITREEIVSKTKANPDKIPDSLLIQMVVIKYQRRGSEALTNASYSGDSETFNNSYPKYILDAIEELKRTNRRLRSI